MVGYGVSRFSKDHDANRKIFEFARAMGLEYLSADPTRDSFDSLDKLVEEYKIAIAIHPHGPSGNGKDRDRWWSAEVIMKAVKDHNKLIGTCLDTGHLIRMAQLGEKLDPAEQVRVMGERNFGMHLKDHDNKRKTDVVFGDAAEVLYKADGVTVQQMNSIDLTHGGADVLLGNEGNDVLIGGALGDRIDGNAGDDLIFGDAVRLERRAVDTSPRFRLAGATLYDGAGNALVGPEERNDPSNTPAQSWASMR